MLIVSDGLISGVQFSLNQLCTDLSQVYVKVPFLAIFRTNCQSSKCFIIIMVLFSNRFSSCCRLIVIHIVCFLPCWVTIL